MTARDTPEQRARVMYAAQGSPGRYALSTTEANQLHQHLTRCLLGRSVPLPARKLDALRVAVTDSGELGREIRRIRLGRPGTTDLARILGRRAVCRLEPHHVPRYVQGLAYCVRRIGPNRKRYLVHEIAMILGRSHEWLRQTLQQAGPAVLTRHGAPERAEQALFERIMHRTHATLVMRSVSSTLVPTRSRSRSAPVRAASRRR